MFKPSLIVRLMGAFGFAALCGAFLLAPVKNLAPSEAHAEEGGVQESNSVILTLAHRIKELRAASASGDAYAQYALGMLYMHGTEDIPQDKAQAAHFWKKAARAGLVDAQTRLGVLYAKGDGIPRDDAAALFWFQRAAQQGDLSAQYNLGVIYMHGLKGTSNFGEAARWWRISAARGNADAQYNLGLLYWKGQGLATDSALARRWFLRAAAQNHTNAQHVLGLFYREGLGGKRDIRAAKHWLEQAGLKDYTPAQYDLGMLYAGEAQNRRGAKPAQKDSFLREAYIWLSLAAHKKYRNAVEVRGKIGRAIPKKLRNQADRIVLHTALRESEDDPSDVYIPNQVHAFQANVQKIDPDTLRISGTLSLNTPQKLESLLEKNKSISTLALDSGGGLLTSGLVIAKIVKKHGLRTRAENQCNSACTFILFASPHPTAYANSIIGFHRARSAVGSDTQNLSRDAQGQVEWLFRSHYKWVGFPKRFIEKILSTPNKGLHVFSKEDLIRANLLKAIYDPAQKRYVQAKIWCARHAALCKERPRIRVDVSEAARRNDF